MEEKEINWEDLEKGSHFQDSYEEAAPVKNNNGRIDELALRYTAVHTTVEYFKDKNPTEEIFMTHMEKVYNFLRRGQATQI